MRDLATTIRGLGHLAATHELYERGATRSSLRAAVTAGVIARVRKGWYCLPELDRQVQRAARVGGRLTCETAATALGLWLPAVDGRLHIAVLPDRTQLRTSDRYWMRRRDHPEPAAHIHWVARPAAGTRIALPVEDVLVHLAQCHDPEYVLVAVESALHAGLVDALALKRIRSRLPLAWSHALEHATAASESGGETLFVDRMRRRGIRCRQQVWFGSDRVDVLIGEALVVEIDGRAYHDRARDNRRDVRLVLRRLRVLHFDSQQVLDDWDAVAATVLLCIARGDHLAS